ncbi:MAG: hypothetical protein MZV64_11380 [Ignavibacteriales bacterium]|nr:hypothetical protein [Ignavibacteriales bacterium]
MLTGVRRRGRGGWRRSAGRAAEKRRPGRRRDRDESAGRFAARPEREQDGENEETGNEGQGQEQDGQDDERNGEPGDHRLWPSRSHSRPPLRPPSTRRDLVFTSARFPLET